MPYAIEVKTEWQLNCKVLAKKVVHDLLKNIRGRGTQYASIPCSKTEADEALNIPIKDEDGRGTWYAAQ